MGGVQMFAVALLLGLLGIAVVNDLRNHRIPNLLVLLGLVLGVVGQSYASGLIGLGHALLGMLVGFAIFLVVKAVNRLRKPVEAAPAGPSEDVLLLREIRDSLKR